MAVLETARLIASLELKDLFSGKVTQIDKSLSKLNANIDHTASRSYRAGQQIGTGIKVGAALAAGAVGLLATNVGLGLKSLSELETITTQTNAVLKSTKGAAGESATAIRDLAEKYEALNATIDDKVIQSGENVLLTFTNIRQKAFEPALQAALNLSTAMGQDLQTSVVQIGKALNDPAKGLTSLQRIGVSFDAQQRKQIKTLLDENDVYGAQKIILAELDKEFGGSFLAGGQTTAGKVAKFRDAIEDLQKALATALLPVIGKVSDALSKFLADPKVVAAITKLGQDIAGLFTDANLAKGADFLKGAFETAKAAAPIVEQAAKASFGFIQAAVALFKQLPAPLQGLLAGGFALNKLTGGLVTNIAGGAFDKIADILGKARGSSPASPVFVSDVSGGLGATGAAGKAGKLAAVADIVQKVAIVSMVAEVAELIHGAISPGGGLQGRTEGAAPLLPGDQLAWPFGPKNTPHIDLGPFKDILGGDSTFSAPLPLPDVKVATVAVGNATPKTFDTSVADLAGKLKDDVINLRQLTRAVGQEFTNAIRQLQHPRNDSERQTAAQELVKRVTAGLGSFKNTAAGLAALKTALKSTHDAKTAAILRAAIRQVEVKIPGRQYAQKQIDKADALLKDGDVSRSDLRKLQAIEQALKDHGLPHAASVIAAKVDAAKKDQVEQQRLTTEAVKDKDLSVTIPVTTVTNVTAGGILKTFQTRVSALGHVGTQ